METGTKIVIAGVGAVVFMVIVYAVVKKGRVQTSAVLPGPGTPPNLVEDPTVAPVQLLNYNDKNNAANVNAKPVMGAAPVKPGLSLKGYSDSVTKSSLKDSSAENTSKLSMQASTKPKMG
jgi:hypothetical protein